MGSWSTTSYEAMWPEIPASGTQRALAMLGDGRMVTGSSDGSVTIRSSSGQPVAPALVGHRNPVTGMAVAGTRLATASLDQTVRLWDLERQQAIGPPIAMTTSFVDISADGRWWPHRARGRHVQATAPGLTDAGLISDLPHLVSPSPLPVQLARVSPPNLRSRAGVSARRAGKR